MQEKEISFTAMKEEGWHPLNASDDSIFQNFVDVTEQTNIGKFREVRMAIEQNDLTIAETKNNNIVTSNTIEENRKLVNDVYLKTHAVQKLEFDAMQQVTLENIACQNPLEGGDAVYSARVMLRRNDICQSSAKMAWSDNGGNTLFAKNNENAIIGEIYPNPNNGNMYLSYNIGISDKATLKIYDVSGKLLLTQMLNSENTLLEISDFNNENGVYYYSIEINDERTINKKLVIIR